MNLTELSILTQKEIEHLFAACAFENPSYAMQDCAWLSPDTILDERVRKFWKALNNGSNGDQFAASMTAGCYKDIIGWAQDLPMGASLAPSAFAREIQRRAYLISTDKRLAELVKARQDNDVELMRNLISELYNNVPVAHDDIPTVDEIAAEFLSAIDDHKTTINTGIPNLDRATGGLERRLEYVLAARPSMGKSTLAFQIARNVVMGGKKALIFSLEMTRLQLWAKAACGVAEVSWKDIRNGSAPAAVIERVKQANSEMIDSYQDRLLIDDRVHHTVETCWQTVASQKPDLIIVDVMARLKDRNESEVRRLDSIVYGLREMAKENNAVLLALHHVNREGDRDNQPPTLIHLRDSGAIEQAADGVFFLWSKDYNDTTKVMPRKIDTDLIIAKNRDDKRNVVVHLKYDSLAQWFEPAEVLR